MNNLKILFFEILFFFLFLKITDPIQISPSHFEKVRQLGSGSIGKVYLAKEKSTQKQYAIKFIKTDITNNDEIIQLIDVVSQIHHPAVLRPYGYSLPDQAKKRPMSIVTDYQEKGSLDTLLQKPDALTDYSRMKILFGIAEALRFLHENSFVHGNLTPGNILLDENLDPILTDYSLLKLSPRNSKINSKDICFFAPEMKLIQNPISIQDSGESQSQKQQNFAKFEEGAEPTQKSDVFSYGLIIYTIITGSYPYDENNLNTASIIQEGQRPPLTNNIPECWQKLISQCWDAIPDRRPSFESIVLRFLRNEFKLPLKDIESIQFRNYQTNCLSSSFATKALISTMDQIESLSDANKTLNRIVESLKRNVELISQNMTQIQKSLHDENPANRETVKFTQEFKPPPSNQRANWAAVNANRRFSTKQPMSRPLIDGGFNSKPAGAKNEDNIAKHNDNILDIFANATPTPTMRKPDENKNNDKDAFPGFSPQGLNRPRSTSDGGNEQHATFTFPTLGSNSPSAFPKADNSSSPSKNEPEVKKGDNLQPFPSFGPSKPQGSILVPSLEANNNNNENKKVSITPNGSFHDAIAIGKETMPPLLSNSTPDLPVAIPPQRQKSLVGMTPAQIQKMPSQDNLKPRLSLQNSVISKNNSRKSQSHRANFSDDSSGNNSLRKSFINNSGNSAPNSPIIPGGKAKNDDAFSGLTMSNNNSPALPLNTSSKKLKKGTSLKEVPTQIQYPYAYDPFDGIFAHLTAEANGNICEKGIITISGNSADPSREKCIQEVVNYEWTKCWTSSNALNSYLEFDFLYHHIFITHYTIKTYPCGAGYSHLRNWVIEAYANDQWYEIDRRDDNNELNGKSKVATFEVAATGEFSKIRIRQTGPNHYGDNYLILTNVEFFGDYL